MVNIALARKVLDHIERYPDNHYQGHWNNGPIDALAADNGDHPACGTTLCFAGWTTFLTAPKGTKLLGEGYLSLPGGRRGHVEEWALNALDLHSSDQADALFFDAANLADLKAMVDELDDNPHATNDDLCAAAGL